LKYEIVPGAAFSIFNFQFSMIMKVIDTEIEGLVILEPQVFGDDRGYFFESFSLKRFEEKVSKTVFVQDNESKSKYGVLRGLHYQLPPYTQAKLVRVVKGRVLDVAVDIRKGSPTFGKHVAVELSEENKLQFFLPKGFAHGFAVLSEEAIFQYKCDEYYAPDHEGAIRYDDPELGIDWKLPVEDIILSEKDKKHPRLQDAIWL
jgi:dTDP-4-dehydrorhamnose 3,5-epimerase